MESDEVISAKKDRPRNTELSPIQLGNHGRSNLIFTHDLTPVNSTRAGKSDAPVRGVGKPGASDEGTVTTHFRRRERISLWILELSE
jgi:hypothetical protein